MFYKESEFDYFCNYMSPYVKHFIENDIGIIEFGNAKGNSLPKNLLEQIDYELKTLNSDSSVKVILLKSELSKAFCGGASFEELKQLKSEKEAIDFFMGFANIINTIRKLDKFIVIRVHGKVVGGGLGIVAACDYAIANEHAFVKLSELSIGIGPFVIEPVVSRKIGRTGFNQLSLDSESWKSPKWLYEKGLYNLIVDSNETLDLEIEECLKRFSNYSSIASKNIYTSIENLVLKIAEEYNLKGYELQASLWLVIQDLYDVIKPNIKPIKVNHYYSPQKKMNKSQISNSKNNYNYV